ncbi:MAG: ABC transporter substrate-binding protein [Candidatus Thorarchaeota archaeon]|jgi:ABC-type transport system substrate-binding protein
MGCKKTRFKKFLVTAITLYFMMSMCSVPTTVAQSVTLEDEWLGPYIDTIRYVYNNGSDFWGNWVSQIQSLLDGDIDVMTTQAHEPSDIEALRTAENVELVKFWRSAAYDASINCDVWPLNISAFRKAFHLAIDKNAICAIQGLRPHDSPLISPFPFSIESEMEHHYYEAEIAEGNAILDSLGFLDSDDDEWREGPGGIEIPPIEIEFHRPEGNGPLLEDAANMLVDAFHNLSINAFSTKVTMDFYSGVDKLNNMDFTIFLLAMIGHDITLDSWIDFWANGRPDWSNTTLEELADVALHSTDLIEVTDAIKEFQYILVEEAPLIILMQLPLYSAYRTDTFDGVVEHPSYGPHSFFTGMNVQNSSVNATGGTIRYGTTGGNGQMSVYLPSATCGVDRTTWFTTKSHMEMLHDSLARIDPELNVINWLAEDYQIETHEDDSAIPDGNTRIMVDLVRNVNWSDGSPLTAYDVVYSINWFLDNSRMISSDDVPTDIYRCVALTPTQLELQFSTESYWHWYKVCLLPILPKHAPNQYNPLTDYSLTPDEFNEDLVVSGPFMASEWVQGEYIEIVQNPHYWRNPKNIPLPPPPPPVEPEPDFTLAIVAGAIGAAAVILVGGFVVVKKTE